MHLKNEILQHHQILSDKNVLLLNSFAARIKEKKYEINLKDDSVPSFLQSYKYPLSPWPIIISKDRKREFSKIARLFPKLITKCILSYFKNDLSRFEEIYSQPQVLYHLIEGMQEIMEKSFLRYDLLFFNNQIKLVEINAGTTCGGWQPSRLNHLYNKILKEDAISRDWNLKHVNPLEAMFKNVTQCIQQHLTKELTGNILLISSGTYDSNNIGFWNELIDIFNTVKPEGYPRIQLFLDETGKDLSVDQDGIVSYKGHELDAILDNARVNVNYRELTLSHIRSKLFFPDNPITVLIGNKINFYLLTQFINSPELSDEEKQLIKDYIPWTALMGETQNVCWKGMRKDLKTILVENKRSFLIKKAFSAEGTDVHIGKFISTDEWETIIEEKFEEEGWIAQEYFEPDTIYSLSQQDIKEHSVIWGVFASGNNYTGSWIRLSELRDDFDGVINSARGAKETIVYEEFS